MLQRDVSAGGVCIHVCLSYVGNVSKLMTMASRGFRLRVGNVFYAPAGGAQHSLEQGYHVFTSFESLFQISCPRTHQTNTVARLSNKTGIGVGISDLFHVGGRYVDHSHNFRLVAYQFR